MRESSTQPQLPPPVYESPWRDLAAVLAITTMSILGSDYFDLNEALYALTRREERFQVDELLIGMLVLLIGLMWLSWRRYVHARHEIRVRRIAETRLGDALIENRRLARENLRIQEDERKHLARELHDELGQYLNAIKLDAVAIRENGTADPLSSTQSALAIIHTIDHVQHAVGDMIARLRPVALDELGLPAALEHCVDHWRQRVSTTRIVLNVAGNFDDLSEPMSLTLYRLVQEGLTNIYKHANAQRATITLERSRAAGRDQDELCLAVDDDGCGMESNARTSRFGLSGMRERVEMAGGTFVLQSAAGRGLRFEAHLPVNGDR